MLAVVLVSCRGRNKVPQTAWLKTVEVYSLSALEAGNLKSKFR